MSLIINSYKGNHCNYVMSCFCAIFMPEKDLTVPVDPYQYHLPVGVWFSYDILVSHSNEIAELAHVTQWSFKSWTVSTEL